MKHFKNRQAKDVSVDCRNAMQLVIRREFFDPCIDIAEMRSDSLDELFGKGARLCRRLIFLSRCASQNPELWKELGWFLVIGVQLIEELEGGFAPFAAFAHGATSTAHELVHDLRHADGNARRFNAPVEFGATAAHLRLLFIFEHQNFVNDRDAVRQRDALQSVGDRATDQRRVRGFALDDDAKCNDGIDLATCRDFLDDERNFKRPGDLNDVGGDARSDRFELAPRIFDERLAVGWVVLARNNGEGAAWTRLSRS
jgi:hypothetical protein